MGLDRLPRVLGQPEAVRAPGSGDVSLMKADQVTKAYDVVVVGAGDVGAAVAFKAAATGRAVALIDKGNVGGTCVNNGCVPSKTLIHAADRICEIQEAARLGICADLAAPDFGGAMGRVRRTVENGRQSLQRAIEATGEITFYPHHARFVASRTLEVGGQRLTGKTIFIATGSRPALPAIPGLSDVPFLTNESVLELDAKPGSLIMLGGGYVGLEYAHFFAAFGTSVVVVESAERLLSFEEPEISALLERRLAGRLRLVLGATVVELKRDGSGCATVVRQRDGSLEEVRAERLFVAAGRRSNSDLLQVEKAGIALDDRGYIRVDDRLRTNRRGVYALGDATGKAMFTHAGDKEAEIAWRNASGGPRAAMDFAAVPHAVFTWPQIASVGLTEVQARAGQEVLIGVARYDATVMGRAMAESDGFAKAIVAKATRRILGFHIIGPHASLLIAEVANAVQRKARVEEITGCMHVFPALSDLVTEAMSNLE